LPYAEPMSPHEVESGSGFASLLATLRQAYADAAAAIRAAPDPQAGFEDATKLADAMREVAADAADLRAAAARRIYEEEQLTLTSLAKRIGVTKQRASQLMQTAKKASDQPAGTAMEGSTDG
jgi:hypothetical protein